MWYKSFSRLTVVAIRADNEIRSILKRDPFSHGAEVEVLICTRPLSSFLLAAHEMEWSYDCPTEWSYWVRSFVTLQDILVELCVTVGSAMLVF